MSTPNANSFSQPPPKIYIEGKDLPGQRLRSHKLLTGFRAVRKLSEKDSAVRFRQQSLIGKATVKLWLFYCHLFGRRYHMEKLIKSSDVGIENRDLYMELEEHDSCLYDRFKPVYGVVLS